MAENSSEGCGVIAGWKLDIYLGNNSAARRATAIQVRAFVPTIGVMKGMLFRSDNMDLDGSPVRFPPSMVKVPASITKFQSEMGFVLINEHGVCPSHKNWMIGRSLDPAGPLGPPPKSFYPDPVSDIVLDLLPEMGIPLDAVAGLKLNSGTRGSNSMAWLRGVADSTCSIPSGHVFIPGIMKLPLKVMNVFMTRSPCVSPGDCVTVPVVTEKPESMTDAVWKEYNSLSFGVVIFGNAQPGMKPLGGVINNDDNDGDQWAKILDQEIVDQLKRPDTLNVPVEEDFKVVLSDDGPGREDWLLYAQEMLISTIYQGPDIESLTGQLYKL